MYTISRWLKSLGLVSPDVISWMLSSLVAASTVCGSLLISSQYRASTVKQLVQGLLEFDRGTVVVDSYEEEELNLDNILSCQRMTSDPVHIYPLTRGGTISLCQSRCVQN